MIQVLAPARAFKAGGTIAANRFVVPGASIGLAVQASTAGTVAPLGVARVAAVANDIFDVYHHLCGVVEVEASAAIAYGALVTFTATGKAVTVSAVTEFICGRALEPATADTQLIGIELYSPVLNT